MGDEVQSDAMRVFALDTLAMKATGVLVTVAALAMFPAQAVEPANMSEPGLNSTQPLPPIAYHPGGLELAKFFDRGAQVGLRNCREESMQYAVGYLEPDSNVLIAKGHFEVAPGEYRYHKFPPSTWDQPVFFRYYYKGDALDTTFDRASSLDWSPFCMS